MIYSIVFILLSIPIFFLSLKSLRNVKSHGFYRFFCWEAILVLLIFKIKFWFTNPFSYHQIISWIMLTVSIGLVLSGIIMLKLKGNQTQNRKNTELFSFEKTTQVIDSGIFKYIRHPMYSSLLFLTWAIYLKNPDWILLPAALFSSLFIILMAKADERECIDFFGEKYVEYKKKTNGLFHFYFN